MTPGSDITSILYVCEAIFKDYYFYHTILITEKILVQILNWVQIYFQKKIVH